MKQYISEIITEKEISKWKQGERILIDSQTGSGKSRFVKNVLYNFCKKNNKTILLLSNRILLKNQNSHDLDKKLDIISLHNYQEFESKILGGSDIDNIFEGYDYIVYDEAHYIFSDSQFNRNTDLLISPLFNTPPHIFLFITATSQALKEYQPSYDYTYNISKDYSHIKNLYFYNRKSIIDSIISHIPKDEKVLYFGSSAKQTLEFCNQYDNSSFICSKNNKLYEFSSIETMKQIEIESKFNSNKLFATKVLDNGVNLEDKSLKHIIVNSSDIITLIQFIGRKRVLSPDDKINVYIKNYHSGILLYIIQSFERNLDIVRELELIGIEEFQKKYRKKNFNDIVDNDFQVNAAKYYHHKTQIKILTDMIQDSKQKGFQEAVCKELEFDIEKVRFADEEFEKISMESLMHRYEGKKLFDEEKEKFKRLFLNTIFIPKKTDYRKCGINAVNAVLQESSVFFKVDSGREYIENQRKTYWKVSVKESNHD